jgi:hypothetical protein
MMHGRFSIGFVAVSQGDPKDELSYVLEQVLLTRDGIMGAFALAVPLGLAGLSPALMRPLLYLLYLVLVLGYYFMIVGHFGRWKPGLPNPAEVHVQGGWGTVMLRAVTGIAVAGLPFVGVALILSKPTLEVVLSWEGSVLLLLASLYLPAAVVTGAATEHPLGAAWIPGWLQVVRADPRGYARLFLRFLIIGSTWGLVTLVTAMLFAAVPVLDLLIIGTVSHLLLFVQAGTVGVYVGNNSVELGFRASGSG